MIRRQQEHDIALVLPAVNMLSRLQFELFFLLHGVIARHQPGELSGLVDDDVADAAGAIAATYETAARGVLYDHEAESMAARRLAAELKETLAAVVTRGGPGVERQVAPVLRAIERGAREMRHATEGGGRAYLLTMSRLVRDSIASTQAEAPAPSSLIIP